MQELDPRIISVSVQVGNTIKTYKGVGIEATGTKYANANQNECEVKITNYDTVSNEFLLTQTTPFNKNKIPKIIRVYAGRQSYGQTQIYVGNIVSATITQPPDQTITFKCLTGNYHKGILVSQMQPGSAKLSTIANQVASNLDLGLNFQATDKDVTNYTYSGAAAKQVDALGNLSTVDAYVDDGVLIVKDSRLPLPNRVRILDKDNGMVGIPELTETGIKVTYLLDNLTVLGGGLRIKSQMYPGANGDYAIYKLGFHITNRDDPFYWIAEGVRL